MVKSSPELTLVNVSYILQRKNAAQTPPVFFVLSIAPANVQFLDLRIVADHLTLINHNRRQAVFNHSNWLLGASQYRQREIFVEAKFLKNTCDLLWQIGIHDSKPCLRCYFHLQRSYTVMILNLVQPTCLTLLCAHF